MSTISASTTSTTAYKVTADTTGTLVLQTGATPTTAVTIGTDQSVTTAGTINGLTVGKGGGSDAGSTTVGGSSLGGGSTNTGTDNSAFGFGTLYINTSGSSNSGFGRGVMRYNTTGGSNSAFGYQALNNNTTSSNNTAVGYQAAYSNTTGTRTIAIGYQAAYTNSTSNYNLCIGYQAGYNTTGQGNVLLGDRAGYSLTTGYANTFVGPNWSAGGACGENVTTGYKNTIIGAFNGNQGGLNITTANNYIVLSDGDGNPRLYNDGTSFYMNGGGNYPQCSITNNSTTGGGAFVVRQNNVYCGAVSVRGSVLGSTANDLALFAESGRGVYTYTNGGTAGPYVASGGTSWTNSSDERLKNITGEIQNGLTKVCSLRAAEFTWKSDETAKAQVGLIAQDVQAVLPEAVSQSVLNKDDDTEYLGVSYTEVIPLLVAAIKELKAEIDTLKGQA